MSKIIRCCGKLETFAHTAGVLGRGLNKACTTGIFIRDEMPTEVLNDAKRCAGLILAYQMYDYAGLRPANSDQVFEAFGTALDILDMALGHEPNEKEIDKMFFGCKLVLAFPSIATNITDDDAKLFDLLNFMSKFFLALHRFAEESLLPTDDMESDE